MTWNNQGQMLVDTSISPTRWDRAMLITVINRTAWAHLADWAVQAATETSDYNLFRVVENATSASTRVYQADNTCSSMPWRAFRFLRDELGCDMTPLVPPRRNFVNYVTGANPPVKVDMGVASQRNEVVDFFRRIDFNLVDMFLNPVFGKLRHNQSAFLYAGDEYWRLHLVQPYTQIAYAADPVRLPPTVGAP